MNRTQKFALNSATSMISQIIVMISGMITPRLMISTYGSEINGLVSSLNQFISYITLVEAGIGGAAIYSLYKPLADNDQSKISSIVVAARNSYRQAGYLFSSGILGLAVIYAALSQSETLSFAKIFFLALLLGVNGCADFFFVSGYRVLLNADQRNYVISTVSIVNTILRTVIICVLSVCRINVVLLYLVVAVTAAIKIVAISRYSKNKYPYIDKNALPDKSSMKKRWDVIYQQILGVIQGGAPTVLVTVLLDLVAVSVYSVYNMVITGLNGVLQVFISGLPAGFGDLIARNEKAKLIKTVGEFETAYYYLLSVAYGLAFTLIMPFVSVYTSGLADADYLNSALGFVIVLNGLLYNIKTPQSMLVVSAGMYKETRWRVTAQGAILILIGFVLGVKWGVVGIVLGSCVSNIYRTVDLLFFTPKYITHAPVGKSIMRMLVVVLNIALILFPSVIIDYSVNNFTEWLVLAVCYGIYSLIVVTLITFAFDRKNMLSVIKRMLGLLLRRKNG